MGCRTPANSIQPGETNPIRTLNEAWMTPLAAGADAILRGGSALFRGAQAAGVAAGLPRDIVAMPEAFLGSPDPLGMPRAPADVSAPEMALRDRGEGKPEEAPQPNEAPPPPEGQEPPSAATATPGAGDAGAAAGAGGNPRGRQCGNDAADIAGTWRKRIRISFRSVIASTTSKRFREEKGLDGAKSSDHNDAARQYVIQRQGDKTAEHVAIYDGNANAITHAGTSLQQETSGNSGRSRRQAARSGRDALSRMPCGLREIAQGDQPLNVSGRKMASPRRQSAICRWPRRPDPSHGWHTPCAGQESQIPPERRSSSS